MNTFLLQLLVFKMQHELLRVLYPVFIHCFMDLVAKGHLQEGNVFSLVLDNFAFSWRKCFDENMPWISARAFFNSFREDHEMIHSRDLQKLEGVLSPSHLEVNYDPTASYIVVFVMFNV